MSSEINREKRINRLLQVRQKSKQIQKQTNSKYKELLEKQALLYLEERFNLFISKKNEEINKLKELLNIESKGFTDAENIKQENTNTLVHMLLDNQIRAEQRFNKAHELFIKEQLLCKQPEKIRFLLLKLVREQEEKRSRYIASKPPIIKPMEIESNNIQKLNYQTRQNKDFDDSCFHRDYDIVRIEKQQVDPYNEAIIKQKETELKLKEKEKENIENMKTKNQRYQHAINQVLLDQRKEQLIKQLQDLKQRDLKRKHENAILNAKLNRSNFIEFHDLNSKFEKQFQIVEKMGKRVDELERNIQEMVDKE
ncbi:hypothetical protein HK103_005653 [Boothiomyces macroporosus]|uniref:Uncharacterized protein n=1 Tax=Boothiomyces macroporosus TaxID=261099 RepID=A0AAD5UEQ8_9FUNG|nr:hypothetical protein HK103_005653 [Boothiomyces macroporosus]